LLVFALLFVVVVFLAAGAFFAAVFLTGAAFFAAGAFFVAVEAVLVLAAGAFFAAAGLAVLGAASFTGPDAPVEGDEVSKRLRGSDTIDQRRH